MILQTLHLSHKYSSNWAIRDINIQIEDNGIVGLLGANGSGKSTTMNIICGTIKQTQGEVIIDGLNMKKEPEEAKKRIGFLPQILPLYKDLTTDEFLLYAAQLRQIPPSKRKLAVEEAKDKCGLSHLSGRLIKNLSGGYRQRVGIAQAIVHKPKLVILDEPTNGLDPNQIIEVRKLIKEIALERSVLFSSHILNEVSLLCKAVIMIESGKVVFSDSMESFSNYATSTTLVVKLMNPPHVDQLMAIEGVKEVEALSTNRFKMHYIGDESFAEKFVAISMDNNWQLREISPDGSNLDNIFKELSAFSSK